MKHFLNRYFTRSSCLKNTTKYYHLVIYNSHVRRASISIEKTDPINVAHMAFIIDYRLIPFGGSNDMSVKFLFIFIP